MSVNLQGYIPARPVEVGREYWASEAAIAKLVLERFPREVDGGQAAVRLPLNMGTVFSKRGVLSFSPSRGWIPGKATK